MISSFYRPFLVIIAITLGGCASNNAQQQIAASNSAEQTAAKASSQSAQTNVDPLEGLNRFFWDINYDILDKFLVKPLTQGYIAITPQFIRTGLLNASDNLEEPANMVNNLLQGKGKASATSLSRFAVNSTVGLLGVFDVASKMGLEVEREDFGQVLGVWGLDTGPYLMLPAMGPSDVRSFSGQIVDNFYWPMTVLESQYVVAANVVGLLETRAVLLEQEEMLNRALDPYLFVRDAYFQRLAYEVSDGKIGEKSVEEIQQESDNFEDFEGLLDDL